MHVFWVLYINSKKNSSHSILLLFYIVPASTEAFISSLVQCFRSRLMFVSARVLCCQPSCHQCFHFATIFKFVPASFICFTARDVWQSLGDEFPWYNHSQRKVFSYEIMRHVNLFSNQTPTTKRFSLEGHLRSWKWSVKRGVGNEGEEQGIPEENLKTSL
jgi:hypothetical protein